MTHKASRLLRRKIKGDLWQNYCVTKPYKIVEEVAKRIYF